MMLIVLVSALAVTALANPLPFPDGCPKVEGVDDFKLADYMGKWYELQRYDMEQEGDSICNTATYSPPTGNGDVEVKNSMTNKETKFEVSMTGWASLAEPDTRPLEGWLKVNFVEGVPGKDYYILKTDYTGYSIVWSCKESDDKKEHEEYGWILSRGRTLTAAQQKEVDDFVADTKTVLSKSLFKTTEQDEKACARDDPTDPPSTGTSVDTTTGSEASTASSASSEASTASSSASSDASTATGSSSGSSDASTVTGSSSGSSDASTATGSSSGSSTTPRATTQAVETTTAGAGSTTASIGLLAIVLLISKALMA